MKYKTKAQRRKIYKNRAKLYSTGINIGCCATLHTILDFPVIFKITVLFPEFALFQPENRSIYYSWFDTPKEREICMLFCAEMCK